MSAPARAQKNIELKEENVIKVSVLYPNTQGCKFDMNYYLTRHMPMVQQKLGAACKRMAVEEGIAGGGPGAPATYVAMGHLLVCRFEQTPDAARRQERPMPAPPCGRTGVSSKSVRPVAHAGSQGLAGARRTGVRGTPVRLTTHAGWERG